MNSIIEHLEKKFHKGQKIRVKGIPQEMEVLGCTKWDVSLSIENMDTPKGFENFLRTSLKGNFLAIPFNLVEGYRPPPRPQPPTKKIQPIVDSRGLTGNPDFFFGGDGIGVYGNHSIVKRYLAAGWNVIPIARGPNPPGGYKRPPKWVKWGVWQERTIFDFEVGRFWCNPRPCGIGIPCGPVSGNLECLDFDRHDYWERWRTAVLDALPGLLDRCVITATPRNGRHVLYRCEAVEPSHKLACEQEGVDKLGKPVIKTRIETRGIGGQFVAPGSPADCHELGLPYLLIQGDPSNTPVISSDERKTLIEIAKGFNLYTLPPKKKSLETKGEDHNNPDAPWNDFNHRGDWKGILGPIGWQVAEGDWVHGMLTRPGKGISEGSSASVGHCGSMLHVFSTNAYPFEGNGTYSKSAVWALLNHDGDFAASARDLVRRGYGGQGKENLRLEKVFAKFEALNNGAKYG